MVCPAWQDAAQAVEVSLESEDGQHTYASTLIADVGSNWARHRATLVSDGTDSAARLAVRLRVRIGLGVSQTGGSSWRILCEAASHKECSRCMPCTTGQAIGSRQVRQESVLLLSEA